MSIVHSTPSFQQIWQSIQLPALIPYLENWEIRDLLDQANHASRNTVTSFTPVEVVWSMVHRALHPDHSIRNTVEHLASAGILITPSGWCQARSRLPEALLPQLAALCARKTSQQWGRSYEWHGRPVYIGDGTTLSMPDTPELVAAFGYKEGKYGPSRFPSAAAMAILHAGVHVVTDFRLAPNKTAELTLWREMIPGLPKGAVILLDRLFCTIPDITLLQRGGIDMITKLHGRRAPAALIREGRSIGLNEWIVPFHLSATTEKRNTGLHLPETTEVRLIRHNFRHNGKRRTIWIVTTMLDAAVYPKCEIVALYRERWGIETHINYLKTPLAMGILRSHSPAAVRSEVGAILLAHNLIWAFMHETAQQSPQPVVRLSFAGAIKTVLQSAATIRCAPLRRQRGFVVEAMQRLAQLPNEDRPNRIEPRLLKRERNAFAYLRTSRAEARKAC